MIAPPFIEVMTAPVQWAVVEVACFHGFIMAMLLCYQWQWKKAVPVSIYLVFACVVGAMPHYFKDLFAVTLIVNISFGVLTGIILRYGHTQRWLIVLIGVLLTYPAIAFIYPYEAAGYEHSSAQAVAHVFAVLETWSVVLIAVAAYALASWLVWRYELLTKKAAYWKTGLAILLLTPLFMGAARMAYGFNKSHPSLAGLRFLITISGFSIVSYWILLILIVLVGF